MTTWNVREFGAVGDGAAVDSPALQAAMDRCSSAGGGVVSVPPGTYRCGTLMLRSGVELRLEAGAVVAGIAEESLYPVIAQTANLPGRIQALVWGESCRNIAVTGAGAIDGGGDSPLAGAAARATRFRPALMMLRGCRGVRMSGVALRGSCYWTLHMMRCRDVELCGLTVRTHMGRINADGIDPDGCRGVRIDGCDIATGDDCIVLKSTEGDDCEDVTVTNCRLRSSCAAIKIGTESLGAIRRVRFSGCRVSASNVGVSLYMKDGGTYEDIAIEEADVEASNDFPIVVDNTPRWYRQPALGTIRNVVLRNVRVRAAGRCYVEGLPDRPVEGLTFEGVRWDITGPCRMADAEKPVGAARGERDPDRVNHAAQPYHFVIVNARGVRVQDVVLRDRIGVRDRGLAYLRNVEAQRLDISGLTPPEGLPPVRNVAE